MTKQGQCSTNTRQGCPDGADPTSDVASLPLADRARDLHPPALRRAATKSQQMVTLNYSQFLTDVSAHKVKTVTIDTNGIPQPRQRPSTGPVDRDAPTTIPTRPIHMAPTRSRWSKFTGGW